MALLGSLVAVLVFVAPLAALALVVRPVSADWRQALLRAAVIFGVGVWLLTEVLSAGGWFTLGTVRACWVVLAVLSVAAIGWRLRRRLPAPRWKALRPAGVGEWLAVAILVLVPLAELVQVLLAPPNTWDVLTYHLPRVMWWFQRHDIGFYPTNIDRQLYSGPFAEQLVAHCYAIAGGDRLAGLPQWLAGLGCAVAASRVALRLGGGRRTQLAAAVLAATLPIAVLEAPTAQNDVVTGFYVLAAVSLCLDDLVDRSAWWAIVGVGGALGVGSLTKGTALVVLPPFLLAWAVLRLRANWRTALLALVGTGAVAALVMTPQTVRNEHAFGHAFGPTTSVDQISSQTYAPAAVTSTASRDLASNLLTPVRPLNRVLEHGVKTLHDWLGIGDSDPRTTFHGTRFALSWHPTEDHAANPLHLLLALAGVVLLLRRRHWYGLALLASVVLFVGYLKWQPWITRLQIPVFLLGVPAGAVALAALWPESGRRRWLGHGLAALAGVTAAVLITVNYSRPLVGSRSVFTGDRWNRMFVQDQRLAKNYWDALAFAGRFHRRTIGLAEAPDDWEYPWWVGLDALRAGVTVVVVNPNPDTSRPPKTLPDVLLCRWQEPCQVPGFHRFNFGGHVTVAVRDGM